METQQSQYGQNRDMKTTTPAGSTHAMNSTMANTDMKTTAESFADKIRSGVEQVQSTLAANTQMKEQLTIAKSKAQDVYKVGENFVKANPLSAILGAAALGFVAAALFRGVVSED